MKYDVELSYGIGFTVSGIEADNQSEAIEKAKQIAEQTMLTTPVTGKKRFYIVPATKTYFDTINAEDKNDAIAAFADSMCLDMSAYFDATEEEPVTYPHAYEHAGGNFEVAMSIIIDTMTSNKKSPYFQKDGLPEINLSDDDFRILGDLQRAYEAIKSIPDRYKIKYRKRFYRLLLEFTGFKFDKKEFGEEGVE